MVGHARSSFGDDAEQQRGALLALGAAPDRLYLDAGLVGMTRPRPALGQALAALRSGDTLVVTALVRLARSTTDAVALVERLIAKQVRLVVGDVRDPMDGPGLRLLVEELQVAGALRARPVQAVASVVDATITRMDTFAEIADERRGLADLLSGLTGEQQAARSLCREWNVREVAAHLIVPLEVSTARFALTMLASRGSFDRVNEKLAREQARRPFDEIVQVLRSKAETRFTPPGAGPEAPLTDLLVHGLDVRWPLRLSRDIPAERLHASLTFLTATPARGLAAPGIQHDLRFEADDIDWAYGSGPTVRGAADALLLAITGRAAALAALRGDGVPALHTRLR